jgi:hypothetical protein
MKLNHRLHKKQSLMIVKSDIVIAEVSQAKPDIFIAWFGA